MNFGQHGLLASIPTLIMCLMQLEYLNSNPLAEGNLAIEVSQNRQQGKLMHSEIV